jgi:hypothetical protein
MLREQDSIGFVARPIIVQCRREIEAGWLHVEAARDVLKRSQWLLTRWDRHRIHWDDPEVTLVPKPEMFIPVDNKKGQTTGGTCDPPRFRARRGPGFADKTKKKSACRRSGAPSV